jgi:SH3-like domain-containing protein
MLKVNIRILLFLVFFFQLSLSYSEEIFLSLKKNKVNVRYGPGLDFPVKYVYRKINLPIKQIDKKENWRRIIDIKNNSGWIHWSQLKKTNSIIILKKNILFKKPSIFSKPIAKVNKGRLLVIQKCEDNWCKIKSEKFKGWIKIDNIWGSIN